MIEIFLLLAATLCVGFFYFLSRKNNSSQPVNRYRKQNKSICTQIVRSAQTYSKIHSAPEKISSTIIGSSSDKKDQNETQTSEINDTEIDADTILGLKSRPKNETPASQPNSSSTQYSEQQTDCVIALYLVAPDNCVYAGYELLQALLSAGLRFGQRRIFHRHTHKDGRGDILFHCASATEPGTFDLTKMGAFTSHGLCLFFSASSVEDPMATFDCLLETLDQLVEDLGGQVLDENRALLTKDKMFRYRQKIRAFETNKTTADMFE